MIDFSNAADPGAAACSLDKFPLACPTPAAGSLAPMMLFDSGWVSWLPIRGDSQLHCSAGFTIQRSVLVGSAQLGLEALEEGLAVSFWIISPIQLRKANISLSPCSLQGVSQNILSSICRGREQGAAKLAHQINQGVSGKNTLCAACIP